MKFSDPSNLLFLSFLFVFSGCQKKDNLTDQDISFEIKSTAIISNSYTSVIATRNDASARISINYFDPVLFGKEPGHSVYPDHYEVYLSKNSGNDWEMIRTIDTSYIGKSFIISDLSNEELYYVYLKEIYTDGTESKNSNVAIFIPSAYKPSFNFKMKEYFGHDLYSFDRNNSNNKIVYATKFYEYNPGYAAPSVFISASESEPQLVDINCWFPVFNNSGTEVLFSSDKGEIFDGNIMPEHIGIYNIITNKSARLTAGYSVNKFPVWSPDNSLIAFSSSETNDQSLRLKVLNREANTCRVLQTGSNLNQGILSYSQEHPAWSPDGKYIYYTQRSFTSKNIYPGLYDIYRIQVNGGTPEPVFKSDRIECTPSISPDNSKLAFLTDLNGQLQIWIYYFGDNRLCEPFDTDIYYFSETWSQIKWEDNFTILFTAYSEERGGDYSLYSISVE
jgi:hypothetical protein